MTIIKFDNCLYKGNIKTDFIRFLLKSKEISKMHKIAILLLSFFSIFSKKKRLWLFLNQKISLNQQVEFFYQTHTHKLNSSSYPLLQGDIKIISHSPYFLVKPFLQTIMISSFFGYDIDFERKKIIYYRDTDLKKQIKNKKLILDRAIDHSFSFYIKSAKEKYISNQFETSQMNQKFIKKYLIRCLCRLAAIVMLSLLIETFVFLNASLPLNVDLFFSYYQDSITLCLNFLPIFVLFILIYLCSEKLWFSFFVTEIPFFILAFANYFKLKYRDYPVVFSDLLILSEAKMMAGKYDITPTYLHLFFILLSVIIIFLLKKKQVTHLISKKYKTIIAVFILFGSYFGMKNLVLDHDLYAQAGDESVLRNVWIESQQLQRRGTLYAFLYSYNSAFNQPPENYDEQHVKEILSAYTTDDIPDTKKINIITIMLESYNDFTKFDLNFNEDIYASFHEICSEGYHGELMSNVFGGGTVNTERCYLTDYFNQPLYLGSTDSYVHYFKSQGYNTVALHPCYGSFYNRRNVNEYIGFDEFYYVENRYNEVSNDDVFFPDIIAEFERQTASGIPYFNYSLTYQNHGPYPKQPNDSIPNYLIGYDNVDEETMNGINYYFNGIKNTNEHLKQLHDYLKNSDKPTVLVLFGDHNPVFGSGSDGFEMLGINMDTSTADGFTNYYGVPYVFWANDAAKKVIDLQESNQGPTISPNYLMNELFSYLGWKGNDLMKYTNQIKEKMPVIHNTWKMVGDTYVQELDSSYSHLIDELKNVEYYYYSHFPKDSD